MTVVGKELAIACARAADDMKAEDIRILDVRGLSSITDFIVICSGTSIPHLKAVLREVEALVLERHAVKPLRAEGKPETKWVVLDYVDVMLHVMDDETRNLYGLEDLWGDGDEIQWS